MNLIKIVENMPKTELHIHIEGSLEPEMAFNMAKKYDMLPLKISNKIINDLKTLKSLYHFQDLQSFLNLYSTLSKCLKSKDDFKELALAFLEKSYKQNVIHCEIFFDPQTHTSRGIPFVDIVDGLNEAFEIYRKKGMTIKLICSLLRDYNIGEKYDKYSIYDSSKTPTGWTTIKQAIKYNEKYGTVIFGIGLDNCEVGYPPKLFKEIYKYAIENGLFPFAHAGEEGPPEYIHEALDLLNVVRIDHGVRCIEDKKLLAKLSIPNDSPNIIKAYGNISKIPLTCCPLSNYKLKVFKEPSENNILQLLDLGIMVTVNSDDPSYFGGYSLENYRFLVENANYYRKINVYDIYKLCINGINACILDKKIKMKYLKQASEYFFKIFTIDTN